MFTVHFIALMSIIPLIEYAGCHALWFEKYFKSGITCFYYRFKIYNSNFEFPVFELNKTFTGSLNYFLFPLPSILFKTFNNNECAFREEFTPFSIYQPIMHGIMIFNPQKKEIEIKGQLNYSPALFLLILLPAMELFISGSPSDFSGEYIALGPSVFGIFWVTQWARYLNLSKDCKRLLQNFKC